MRHRIYALLIILFALLLQGCWSLNIISEKDEDDKRTINLSMNEYEFTRTGRSSGAAHIVDRNVPQQHRVARTAPFKPEPHIRYMDFVHYLNARDVRFRNFVEQTYGMEYCTVDCPSFYLTNTLPSAYQHPYNNNGLYASHLITGTSTSLGLRIRF